MNLKGQGYKKNYLPFLVTPQGLFYSAKNPFIKSLNYKM